MAAKKKARRNTRWRAVTWERTYRGVAIWVETMYARSPNADLVAALAWTALAFLPALAWQVVIEVRR